MEKHPASEIERIQRATRYSLAGLRIAWREQQSFRAECIVALFAFPVARWLATDPWELAALCGVLLLVLIVELLNSAVEGAIDRIGPEHHPISGKAKDLGSAAVFVSLVLALIVWAAAIVNRFA